MSRLSELCGVDNQQRVTVGHEIKPNQWQKVALVGRPAHMGIIFLSLVKQFRVKESEWECTSRPIRGWSRIITILFFTHCVVGCVVLRRHLFGLDTLSLPLTITITLRQRKVRNYNNSDARPIVVAEKPLVCWLVGDVSVTRLPSSIPGIFTKKWTRVVKQQPKKCLRERRMNSKCRAAGISVQTMAGFVAVDRTHRWRRPIVEMRRISATTQSV